MKVKTTFKELCPGDKFTSDKYPEALFLKLCMPINSHSNTVNLINGYTCHFTLNSEVYKRKVEIRVYK